MIELLALAMSPSVQADETAPVLEAIARLSESSETDGGGPDVYAGSLCPGFTRWTPGSDETSDKNSWLDGVRGWWDEGWRVSERETEWIQVTLSGKHAFVRRNVAETYTGPDGEESSSRSALVETWSLQSGGWCLLHANGLALPAE
ncbi:hypothetical protein [Hyphobacterium sp.]|uniref:hypothetical protein n=1 Tax=Hyphobacterium sp. TaxID=2004662 RepID=UPI00374A4603